VARRLLPKKGVGTEQSLASRPRVVSVDDAVAERIRRLDVADIRLRYLEQGNFVVVEDLLPPENVRRLVDEVERVRPRIHRSRVPGKKSGSVGWFTLRDEAPAIVALYHSPALLAFFSQLAGRSLRRCPERDPHSCALYVYTEPGDHITAHYDTSFYRGARYTALVALVNRTTSRLVGELHTRDQHRVHEPFALATEPGMLVFFDGDRLWHGVTPLGPGEERVVLTMQFVTDARMKPFHRFVSDMKDAISYFGFREVFRRRKGGEG
jgi:alkylated DNA repair dioxygenase AlkB